MKACIMLLKISFTCSFFCQIYHYRSYPSVHIRRLYNKYFHISFLTSFLFFLQIKSLKCISNMHSSLWRNWKWWIMSFLTIDNFCTILSCMSLNNFCCCSKYSSPSVSCVTYPDSFRSNMCSQDTSFYVRYHEMGTHFRPIPFSKDGF